MRQNRQAANKGELRKKSNQGPRGNSIPRSHRPPAEAIVGPPASGVAWGPSQVKSLALSATTWAVSPLQSLRPSSLARHK